jgi:hypothetical protein
MLIVLSIALIIVSILFIIVILSGIDELLLKGHFARKLRNYLEIE